MAKLQPLHPGLGQLVNSPHPHTALSTMRYSPTGRQTGEGSRRTWTHKHRVHHPGQWLILEQVEPLIHSRMANIKSAFMAVDRDGTGLVSKEEFRRVLQRLLCVSQNQLDTLVTEVCERSSEAVDYMQFLRSFRRAPAAHRACSSRSSVRRGPQNSSMSLSEIQKHLKEKIGGNLRTVIRVLRLFDYNREGHIQQHEFRRILDNYCIRLTDKEFQRLWNHYSPNSKTTISYELFLDKLGFGASHNFKVAPVCAKLEVSSRRTTPLETVKQKKLRSDSLSSSYDVPSVLPERKLQTLFYNKMCMNSTPVWQALQVFDTTHSGLVKQDVLRAILSIFIFPMNPHSFHKLTSSYGVGITGPVRWKHFLGHFMSPLKEKSDTNLHSNSAFEHPSSEEDNLHLQDLYPRLTEIFNQLDTKEAGWITRADLRHHLERPGGTQLPTPQPRLRHSQITELLNTLDTEHTGVIRLAGLKRLNPNITSAPKGYTAPPPSPANATEPLDVPEHAGETAEQQETPDERQTTQGADKVSVASASWRTVENLLLDDLCERLSSVLAALKLCDPQHTGYITREDLKKVLSSYGMPISDTHFNNLCDSSGLSPGNSEQVCYARVLRNLGVPLTDETHTSSSHKESNNTGRPCTSPQSSLQSVRGERPPSSLQIGPDTYNILDKVFQRMKLKLTKRHTSLTGYIQTVTGCSDGPLSETDVRKILEDSWVILDDKNFNKFTELLGFRDGRIECSAFLAKYEEATARGGQQGFTGRGDKDEVDPLLISAEQCLAAMKTRNKIIHGDNLTAFRLMDRKRKGVVDCHDFKELYNSLGFFCRKGEYQQLLDLIGLHPGGNLNYTEFVDVVENNGKHKQEARTASVQEQIHELLASEARFKWADMSKVLCQFDIDGHGWIHKKSLRGLLFTYALPMGSDEFDQLWSRYDPESRGSVALCDFMEKLGFHNEGELRPQSQKLNQTVAQQDADGLVSSDAASQECTELNISMDEQRKKSDLLSGFDNKAEKKNESPPASPDAVSQIESLDKLSPDMALARMRELVTASVPNLQKAFLAFDRSGTGTVKALEFRQVIHKFCARPSDKQYRYMLTKLKLDCENSTVNWKDFLKMFSIKLMSPDRCSSRILEHGTDTRSPIQTKTSITEQLQQIQKVVSGHLYVITQELMDLDPTNSTTVSKEQFRQLCDRHSLRLTNDEFECVWSQMPVNEQKKLQYREFLRRFGAPARTFYTEAPLSPEHRETVLAAKSCLPETAGAVLHRTKPASQCSSRRPPSVGRSGTGSLERRLRGVVQRCWKEILRKCTEEDPQQEGHISTSSFLEILQSVSISVTPEQFEHLAVKFDIKNNGHVSYHKFFRHFLLNLKPAEAIKAFEQRGLHLTMKPASKGILSKDCVELMLRIHDVVGPSWSSIRRCFLTSDCTRTGMVSMQDFRKVLRHFSVSLSEEEFFHLSSYFDANATGKICYDNFLWAFLH